MKRKLSLVLAMIIVLTNVVFVTMTPVSAADADAIVSDDFETGYTPISANAAATLASMQELLDMNPWWYSVKQTVFNKADDVNGNTPLIASVVTDGSNEAMRIEYHAEAGVGTNITTPSRANYFEYEAGSYEVSFKFYTTGNMQILGIGGKLVNDTANYYVHNIFTQSGTATYMGDTEYSSPAGIAGTGVIQPKTWYILKIVTNNDLGYYSVELLDKNGNSIQRTGGINFEDGCPAISNIRFQSTAENSVVYIDDYAVKKVDADRLLYEDDFNTYTALSGTTTAGANVFKENSQFRVPNTSSAYALASNETGKYFVLNKNGNALYMPWNGHILTKDSQTARGKLQMKFSFCIDSSTAPSKTTAGFRVICADNYTSIADFYDTKYTMFRVQPFSVSGGVAYGIQKADGEDTGSYQQISKGKWYDVELTFDLANNNVNMKAKEQGTTAVIEYNRSTGLYNGGTALASIKGITFHANDGMIIGIDDVEIKYIQDAPSVNEADVEIIDFNGKKISAGATGVNPALTTVKIPFTLPVTDDSVKNITLQAENSEEAFSGYTATNADGVYTMTFNKPLTPNTKYVLTVPTTVSGVSGSALVKAYTCEFTTGDGKAELEMIDIKINSIADIKNDGSISVEVKGANSTNTAAPWMMICGFYDADNVLLGSSHISSSFPANSISLSAAAYVTVPAAESLDLSKVNKVSVYLWDSYKNIIPYCAALSLTNSAEYNE